MADKAQYFYGTQKPHHWNSGPTLFYLNDDYYPISSLEEARILAAKYQTGKPGYENYIKTTYGVTYDYIPEEIIKFKIGDECEK